MAEKNYYSILNVPCSATTEEIKQAYKNLALKTHPDKNKRPDAEERFKEIAEAHSILSIEERREEYDRSREASLLFGIWKKTSSMEFAGPDISFEDPRFKTTRSTFEFQGSTETSLDDFFYDDELLLTEMMNEVTIINGSTDCTNPRKTRPFEEQFLDDIKVPNKKIKRQDPAVEEELFLSLEELFTGVTKKLKISRKVYNQFGNYFLEEKILLVKVLPGWKEGTKITFASEGDRKPGVEPADVVFKLKDKTHKHFSRDSENNLIYICKMSLRDALVGRSVDILTIDGKILRIHHDSIVQPGTQKLIKGEGLPLPKNPSTRADLIVKYDILFPHYLSPHQKQVIVNSLPIR